MDWLLRATDRIVRWYAPVRAALVAGAGEVSLLESDWSAMTLSRESRAELLRGLDTWERLGTGERVGVGVLHHLMMTLNRMASLQMQNDYLTIELWAERENTNATPWDALLHPLFAELFETYRGGRGKPILAYGYVQDTTVNAPFSVSATEYAGAMLRITHTDTTQIEIDGKRRLTNGAIEEYTFTTTRTGSGVYYTPDVWVEISQLGVITSGNASVHTTLGAGRLF